MKSRFSKFLMIILAASLIFTSPASEAKGRGKIKISSYKNYTRNTAKVKKIAQQIASGHALKKHADEFPSIAKLSSWNKKKKAISKKIQSFIPKAKIGKKNKRYYEKNNIKMVLDPNNKTAKRHQINKKNKMKGGRRKTDLGTIYSTDKNKK